MARGATRPLALILATGFTLLGCEGDALRRVRTVTYPPDFHYISEQEIRTTMGSLAIEVVALDEIMRQRGGPLPEDRDEVVAILTRMRGLAAQLKKGTKSNHPRIDRDAPRLKEDIDRALAAARTTTRPNYYDAGLVVGACTYCHVPRHGRRID